MTGYGLQVAGKTTQGAHTPCAPDTRDTTMQVTRPGISAVLLLVWSIGTLAAAAPHLTKKHTGWRRTACFECHDTSAMAKVHTPMPSGPAECGRCHGYNGAPHEAHAVAINPCGTCHARVEHAAAFQSPAECIKCHVHPKSPQGR